LAAGSKTGVRILVVDDDGVLLRFLEATLAREGHEPVCCGTAEEAVATLDRQRYDLVITDIQLPGMSGLELMRECRLRDADLQVILITAYGSIEDAVSAMRQGAVDYITKPLRPDDVRHRVRQAIKLKSLQAENRWLHDELAASYRPDRIVAASKGMRDVVATVERMAKTDSTVLITGESGTGKELVARALHYGGPRADGPFVAVNCAALPPNLVESELFGHARGAFTGAVKDHPGKMEAAHRGTLFLDEVSEMPLDMQPKLLRAVQERSFERVGENRLRRVDVRIVAATNRDLEAFVGDGRFREDLYYRLAVVPIRIPPLRERPEDIGPLARYVVRRITGDETPDLTDAAVAELTRRTWRGNVRELANVLEYALAMRGDGPIDSADLPPPDRAFSPPARATGGSLGRLVELPTGGAALDDMVRDLVIQALEAKNWNQSAAARLLRIPRHVLQYRISKYGIAVPARDRV